MAVRFGQFLATRLFLQETEDMTELSEKVEEMKGSSNRKPSRTLRLYAFSNGGFRHGVSEEEKEEENPCRRYPSRKIATSFPPFLMILRKLK